MGLAWRRLFSTVAEHTGVVARRVTSPSPRAALPAPRVSGDGGWWIGSGPLQKAEDPIRRDSSVLSIVAPGIFAVVPCSKPQGQPLASPPRPAMRPWQSLALVDAVAVGIAALMGSPGGARFRGRFFSSRIAHMHQCCLRFRGIRPKALR